MLSWPCPFSALLYRLAAHAHKVRAAKGEDPIDRQLATSLGLDDAALARLMAEVGFQIVGKAWKWRGQRRRAEPTAAPRPGNAFAALAGLKR